MASIPMTETEARAWVAKRLRELATEIESGKWTEVDSDEDRIVAQIPNPTGRPGFRRKPTGWTIRIRVNTP